MCSSSADRDLVRESFLWDQLKAGMRLAESSDLIDLNPLGPEGAPRGESPPERYVLHLRCHGLVMGRDGQVSDVDHFLVGIWFHENYQRRVEPALVAQMIAPVNVWHPNVFGPAMCLGHITCATGIVDIISQVWRLLSYREWTPHDALNRRASDWALQNRHLFPTDPRPLLRRAHARFEVVPVEAPSERRQSQ